MMVSYAGWDELKREMGLKGGKHGEMPNSADLKALAKIYNHALKDKLDFTPITQADEEGTVITKGYRINMQKLHKWIVDQALYHGKQQAHAVQMLAWWLGQALPQMLAWRPNRTCRENIMP